jgi:sterol desaturase/sphingolipid hydroxylase (fatty acid hydroxylase superfamily)
MHTLIVDNALSIRLVCFITIFTVMFIWELLAPKRPLSAPKGLRWINNISLTIINSLVVGVILPFTVVGAAILSETNASGIFNMFNLSSLYAGILSIIILDFTIYAQHALFHKVMLFWRLHRMHHTDLDIDVTTGARFHTIEIVLSLCIKIAVVILLGAPAWSVLCFEILLNATSMFNHSNIKLPERADSILRRLVVTPDMHRVHHSVVIAETDSNFGFNFPWWDRLFGTYRDQPAAGHAAMVIGLANYRDTKYLKLPWMLAIPFLKKVR